MAIISDTHNNHRSLLRMPEDADNADILLHCGDATNRGCTVAWEDLDAWMGEVPVQHRLLVPGNHDVTLDDESWYFQNRWRFHDEVQRAPEFRNVTLLRNRGISCCGLNIYGFPQVPPHHDWAFGAGPAEMERLLSCIPENVDVLATHGPPTGSKRARTDDGEDIGCAQLAQFLRNRKDLLLHCFGHVHSGYGRSKGQELLSINAAMCNSKMRADKRTPFYVDFVEI